MAEEKDAEAPAVKAGGAVGKIINAASAFALTLAAVVLGGFINAALHPVQELELDKEGRLTLKVEPVEQPAARQAKGPQPALFYAFDPPLVVNFEDGAAIRFLQVQVEVMSRDQAVVDAVAKNAPIIRNNLMLLFSNRPFGSLMTREGKEGLRKEALAEVKAIVKRESGSDAVEDLLFTSFVVQ